ncbi:MAG TPA: transcription-repair coupling factor [Vicinamibacterales bacterium]|jgi:transcription-repair coupling factor (superfamily II helicase)
MSTSLTLQALLKATINKVALGVPGPTRVTGLSPAAQALYLAAAANRQAPAPRPGTTGSTIVVVVPTDADVEQTTADVRFFLAALEGLSDAAVLQAVLPFPSHEVDPYRGLSPHLGVLSARTRALHAAATGTARVIVASATAMLPRVSAPTRLLEASLELKSSNDIDPYALAELLVDAGFTRQDPVDSHGEFCVRGGVIDIFPAGSAQPVRLDFVGDTVESIRQFDPATQRSTGEVERVTIVPLKEVFGDRAQPAGPASRPVEDDKDPARQASWPADDDDSDDPDDSDDDVVAPPFDPSAKPAPNIEPGDRSATLLDFVKRPLLFVCETDDVRARAEKSIDQLAGSYRDVIDRTGPQPVPPIPAPETLFIPLDDLTALFDLATHLDELDVRAIDTEHAEHAASDRPDRPEGQHQAPGPEHLAPFSCQPSIEFRGRIADWVAAIKSARQSGETVLFVAETPGRAERTVEVLSDYELIAVPVFVDPRQRENVQARGEMAHAAAVLVAVGTLSRGFRLPDAGLQIFAESDVFEEERRAADRRRSASRAFLSDFRDLKVGDFVVHVDHGIGRFVGLRQISTDPYSESTQEFLELRYAGDDKLFVPVERLDLLQKYTGASRPSLDRMGGTTWERAKTRVKKAMRDMAEELLKLYAQRKAVPGHSFSPDTHWQEEFEGTFPYDLTVDQKAAISDIKSDMESSTPMDRLLCGDVGYGKTEVAMRAAFKAVMDGKQVAFLAPTTVLAFQHLKTLRERFAGFPVRIDMVSRFRTKGEIKQTLTDLAEGKIEAIVGTHRLLSKDVLFKDLGLLVVDEEQRFGVAHKERIKQMRRKVDVLTMTATPIPRTLNMSLVGIRDMSIIETPPKDRLAIQTNVVRFDQQLIARVVRNELARGGQIYFVHNRVESIYAIGDLVQRLVPEAKIVIGHGQMSEDALERAMVDFVARKYDILLATTIVENGLDIPNVNTILINRADRYGLSQLYQLRGRVGRSDRPAYAYLLIPPGNTLSPIARKRLAAIREFSDLGSGFRVAALDLEIRGAGNLLGGEQSGHIEAIGFEMYMKLLEQTVRELKGEEVEDETRATVNLNIDLRIGEAYVPEQSQRLALYRRVAGSRTDRELEGIIEEIQDRYGPMPAEVLNLVDYGRIRIMADRIGVEKIDRQGSSVVFTFKGQGGPDPNLVIRLVREHPEVTLAPPASLKLDLNWKAKVRDAGRALKPADRAGRGAASFTRSPVGSGDLRRARRPQGTSWWTARATEDEVRPGFSKEAILRPTKEDPRGPDGVLTRVAGVLSELVGSK